MNRRNQVLIVVLSVLVVSAGFFIASEGFQGLRFRAEGFLDSLGLGDDYGEYSADAVSSANATSIAVSCTAISDAYGRTESEDEMSFLEEDWRTWKGGVCERAEDGLNMEGSTVKCSGLNSDEGCEINNFDIPSGRNGLEEDVEPRYVLYYEGMNSEDYGNKDTLKEVFRGIGYGFEGMGEVERARIIHEALSGTKNRQDYFGGKLSGFFLSGRGFEKVLKVRLYSIFGILDKNFLEEFGELASYRKRLSGTSYENIRKYDSILEAYFGGERPFRNDDPEFVLRDQLEGVVNKTDIEMDSIIGSLEVLRDKKLADRIAENISERSNLSEVERFLESSDSVMYAEDVEENISEDVRTLFVSFEDGLKSSGNVSESFFVDASAGMAEKIFELGQTGEISGLSRIEGYRDYRYLNRVSEHSRDVLCGSESLQILQTLGEEEKLDKMFQEYRASDGSENMDMLTEKCSEMDIQELCGVERSVDSFEPSCKIGTTISALESVKAAEEASIEPGEINSLYMKKRGWNKPQKFEMHPAAGLYLVSGKEGYGRLYFESSVSKRLDVESVKKDCSLAKNTLETSSSMKNKIPEVKGREEESLEIGLIKSFRGSLLNIPDRCKTVEGGCKSFHQADVEGAGEPYITYLDGPVFTENYSGTSSEFRVDDVSFKPGSRVRNASLNLRAEVDQLLVNIRQLEVRKNRQEELFRALSDEMPEGELWKDVKGFTITESCELTEPGFKTNCEGFDSCKTTMNYRGSSRQYISWNEYCESFLGNITALREILAGRGSGVPFSQIGFWEFEGAPEDNMLLPNVPEKKVFEGLRGKTVCLDPGESDRTVSKETRVITVSSGSSTEQRFGEFPKEMYSELIENPVASSEALSSFFEAFSDR